MKLLILAVGNKMPAWITEGFNEYTKRMPREATISLIEIKPEARNSGKTAAQIMEAEAQRIKAALPASALCIALDERGATPTTKQLAQQMQDWMQQGRDVAFIIGGADGLHESVKHSANNCWPCPPSPCRTAWCAFCWRSSCIGRIHSCTITLTTGNSP